MILDCCEPVPLPHYNKRHVPGQNKCWKDEKRGRPPHLWALSTHFRPLDYTKSFLPWLHKWDTLKDAQVATSQWKKWLWTQKRTTTTFKKNFDLEKKKPNQREVVPRFFFLCQFQWLSCGDQRLLSGLAGFPHGDSSGFRGDGRNRVS